MKTDDFEPSRREVKRRHQWGWEDVETEDRERSGSGR